MTKPYNGESTVGAAVAEAAMKKLEDGDAEVIETKPDVFSRAGHTITLFAAAALALSDIDLVPEAKSKPYRPDRRRGKPKGWQRKRNKR